MHAILIISIYVIYCISFAIKIRASDRLRKKVKFCGNFRDIFGEKSADFAEISRGFLGKFCRKTIGKNKADFGEIFWANFARN